MLSKVTCPFLISRYESAAYERIVELKTIYAVGLPVYLGTHLGIVVVMESTI